MRILSRIVSSLWICFIFFFRRISLPIRASSSTADLNSSDLVEFLSRRPIVFINSLKQSTTSAACPKRINMSNSRCKQASNNTYHTINLILIHIEKSETSVMSESLVEKKPRASVYNHNDQVRDIGNRTSSVLSEIDQQLFNNIRIDVWKFPLDSTQLTREACNNSSCQLMLSMKCSILIIRIYTICKN